MTAFLIVLLLLALVFGVGAVLKGIFWLIFLAVALIVVLAVVGWFKFRGTGRTPTTTL